MLTLRCLALGLITAALAGEAAAQDVGISDVSVDIVRAGRRWVPSVGVEVGVWVPITEDVALGGSFGPIVFPTGSEPEAGLLRVGQVGVEPRVVVEVDLLSW